MTLRKRGTTADPPECAVCGRPVDLFSTYVDTLTLDQVYVAECHGEREEVRLSVGVMARADVIAVGRAFERKTLAGEPRVQP